MGRIKSISWVIGISIIVGATGSAPATAIPPNQSDITGTNVWNNTVPQFNGGTTGLDPEILSKATQLAEQLEQVNADFNAAEARASQRTRRFGRRGRENMACVNPQADRLNRLMLESKTFLNGLDRAQAEILKNSPAFRTW